MREVDVGLSHHGIDHHAYIFWPTRLFRNPLPTLQETRMLAFIYRTIFLVCCLSASFSSFFMTTAVQARVDFTQEDHILDVARELIDFRSYMISRGLEFPLLTQFLSVIWASCRECGLEVDDAIFNRLYAEFQASEIAEGIYE